MPPSLGTRLKQGFKYERLAQGAETRTHTRDLGLTPLVSASITFSSSGASATGANGTFGVSRPSAARPITARVPSG
jgi:hypothetical protein